MTFMMPVNVGSRVGRVRVKYRHRRRGLKPRLPEMVWPREGEISSCLRSGERKRQQKLKKNKQGKGKLIRHTQNNVQGYARSSFWVMLGVVLMLSSCQVPGGNQKISKIRISVQNPLPIARKNVPIVLTGEYLRKVNSDFSFKAYSVAIGKAPQEMMLPSQADDLDYDGERDELSFLVDLEPQETKEISILYNANLEPTLTLELNKQTRAGIFPELDAVAAMESNLIAYVLRHDGGIVAYGKKREELFSVDSMFQYELDTGQPLSPDFRLHFESNNIVLGQQVEVKVVKPARQWVLADVANKETYFIRKSDEQLNFSKSLGLSLNTLTNAGGSMVALTRQEGGIGCGGFALWDEANAELIPMPMEGDYVRILANGSIRSVVQRIFPSLQLDGESVQFTSTTFIYGDSPWIEQRIYVRGLPANYAIVTGIPNLGDASDSDEEQGWLWSWGTDAAWLAPLGVALIYPTTGSDGVLLDNKPIDTVPDNLSLRLAPDAAGWLSYRAFAIWGGGTDGIETEAEFAQHVQITATAMKTPPRIKSLPREEK